MSRPHTMIDQSSTDGRKLSLQNTFLFLVLVCALLPERAFAEPRNLVLITIDTLRADYLSCNGSKEAKTPNLDVLASRGVNFQRVRTAVPLTLPAHASILTSLFPPENGVRDNAAFSLSETHTTLAEVLRKQNYRTAAFVGSFVLDHRFGLAQGFEIYDDRMSGEQESPESERNGDEVYAAFYAWFEKRKTTEPFFVWIHLYDPHAPYKPPAAFAKLYPRNPYAGEVAFSDAIVGKILKNLETAGLSAKTVVAVAGDHGEGLGQHGEGTHSVLTYNTTLSVPLIIADPPAIPAGTKVSELVRTIDLAPTLLDYLGVTANFGKGQSLRSLIEHKEHTTQPAYSESLYPKLNLGWSELRGIEDQRFHFILAPHPELYDVTKDPDEKQNVIQQQPAAAAQLKAKLESIARGSETPSRPVDAETAEKLRSLGYVSGSPQPASNANIDPKDKMQVWNEIQLGIFHFSEAKYQLAARTFRSVLADEKKNVLVYDYLCSSYMRLQDWPGAEKCYADAAAAGVSLPSASLNLGIIAFNKRELMDARDRLREAVERDPRSVVAHYYMGNVLRALGELQSAANEYQAALSINPSYFFAVNGLAMTYASMKMDAEALKNFQEAVRIEPQNPGTYYNLGVQLARMNRKKEALKALEKFLTIAKSQEFLQQRQRAAEIIQKLKQS